MKEFLELQPTSNQNFRLMGYGKRGDLTARLEASFTAASNGDMERCCQMRYDAFQDIVATLPDDEQSIVELDRNHNNTLAAMKIIYFSAMDNYLIADYELAAAQLELLIESDDEDPLEATPLLALCYCGLGEWECLEDIYTDLGDKTPLQPLCRIISRYAQEQTLDQSFLSAIKRHHDFCNEIVGNRHLTEEQYIREINSEHPSREALAHEIYLLCEPILQLHNGLIQSLATAIKG